MDHDLVVLSPEKTILTYRLSGLGSRILAHFLDLIILGALLWVISMFVALTISQLDPMIATGIILFMFALGWLLYFILQEGLWNGQTLGKKAAGLRVRMADGTPITFGAAVGRNLLRFADFLPGTYFVGLLAMFTNPKSQRLGDLISNTVVVYEKRGVPMFSPSPHTAGLHALESYVGDLRGMTIEEYNALRRFADRFPELSTEVQIRLTKDVWQPIAQRRGVPSLPNVHPIYLAEAVVMKYGRAHGLL